MRACGTSPPPPPSRKLQLLLLEWAVAKRYSCNLPTVPQNAPVLLMGPLISSGVPYVVAYHAFCLIEGVTDLNDYGVCLLKRRVPQLPQYCHQNMFLLDIDNPKTFRLSATSCLCVTGATGGHHFHYHVWVTTASGSIPYAKLDLNQQRNKQCSGGSYRETKRHESL